MCTAGGFQLVASLSLSHERTERNTSRSGIPLSLHRGYFGLFVVKYPMTSSRILPFFLAFLLFLAVRGISDAGSDKPSANGADNDQAEALRQLNQDFLGAPLAGAQRADQKIRVHLRVSAPDEIQSNAVKTMIDEFKKFDDVSVELTDFDYEISVVVAVITREREGPVYLASLVVAKSPGAVLATISQPSVLIGHNVETGDVASETNTHVFYEIRSVRRARTTAPAPFGN